jgi:hypothetical protein
MMSGIDRGPFAAAGSNPPLEAVFRRLGGAIFRRQRAGARRGYLVRRGGATEFGELAGSVWSGGAGLCAGRRRWALRRAAARLALGTRRHAQL